MLVMSLLCALAMTGGGITTWPTSASLTIVNSEEFKHEPLFYPGSGSEATEEDKHLLKVRFHLGDPHFPTGTSRVRYINIQRPHAFCTSAVTLHHGFCPVGTAPTTGSSSEWIYAAVDGVNDIDLAYWDESSGVLHGGTTMWVVYEEKAYVSGSWQYYSYTVQYNVVKNMATGDGPVDSRLIYGEPNTTWTTVDSNGELKNFNFNPWTFRGGLFVGTMPLDTNDRSGIARSQLWFSALSSTDLANLQYAHVSLMHLGFWPVPSSVPYGTPASQTPWKEIKIGLWGQGASSVTESTATWANRWGPPHTDGPNSASPPSPAQPDPISEVTFPDWTPGTSSKDYANWYLGTDGSSTRSSTALEHAVLCTDYEDADILATAHWRYFVGKESSANQWKGAGADAIAIPASDLKPRMWEWVINYAAEGAP